MKLGFIGTGRMGSALIRGLVDAGVARADILARDKDVKKLESLKKELGVKSTSSNRELVERSDVIFIAVKPAEVGEVLEEIKRSVGEKLVISIAAGVRVAELEKGLGRVRLIRAMPNLPCQVREGAVAYCSGKYAQSEDRKIVGELFGKLGVAVELSEDVLDVVTGMSGSGPAFLYLAIDGMARAAEKEGLPREVALKLAAQTAKGAGEMLLKTGAGPRELIEAVRSPKGTTEEGLKALERYGVAKAFEEAVLAATKRAKELAGRK